MFERPGIAGGPAVWWRNIPWRPRSLDKLDNKGGVVVMAVMYKMSAHVEAYRMADERLY